MVRLRERLSKTRMALKLPRVLTKLNSERKTTSRPISKTHFSLVLTSLSTRSNLASWTQVETSSIRSPRCTKITTDSKRKCPNPWEVSQRLRQVSQANLDTPSSRAEFQPKTPPSLTDQWTPLRKTWPKLRLLRMVTMSQPFCERKMISD